MENLIDLSGSGPNPISSSGPISIDTTTFSKDKINEKIVYSDYAVYSILNYGNLGLSYNDVSNSLYRSVVLSCPERRLLCFSPPKTHDVSEFIKKCPLLFGEPDLLINEIVEGVMINLFYEPRSSMWEISTKSGVSGRYSYGIDRKTNERPTFLKLFLDTLHASKSDDLNDLELVKHLPKDMCYSFILQHPKNKICLDLSEPALYLAAVYLIEHADKARVRLINPRYYKKWPIFQYTPIRFPEEIDPNKSLNDIVCQEMSIQRNIKNRGVMITRLNTGEMFQIQNIEYLKLFKRRNAHHDLLYKYLCFLHIGKISEYLSFYPLEKKAFRRHAAQFNDFITNVYDSYVLKYVLKKNVRIKETYYKHIYKLHYDVYIPSLKRDVRNGPGKGTEKQKITLNVVREYFMKQEPHVLAGNLRSPCQ